MNRRERRAEASRQRRLPVVQRACGECTACCTILGVRELGKGFFTRCEHEDGGCRIYEGRPQSCRNFACQWLLGGLGPDDRPDRLGIMFDVSAPGPMGRMPVANEAVPGASDTGRGAQVLRDIARSRVVLVIRADGSKRFVGPPGTEYLDIVAETESDGPGPAAPQEPPA